MNSFLFGSTPKRDFRGLLFILLVATSGCDDSTCVEAKRHLADCGWEYDEDPCKTTEHDRCVTECYGALTCEELDQRDAGSYDRTLGLCLMSCAPTFMCDDDSTAVFETWVCDGEKDCLDGSDEEWCRYFECLTVDELIWEYYVCDGYQDCADGSDEEICGTDAGIPGHWSTDTEAPGGDW